jgi:hypothetical protein
MCFYNLPSASIQNGFIVQIDSDIIQHLVSPKGEPYISHHFTEGQYISEWRIEAQKKEGYKPTKIRLCSYDILAELPNAMGSYLDIRVSFSRNKNDAVFIRDKSFLPSEIVYLFKHFGVNLSFVDATINSYV